MSANAPWSVKGIDPKAREIAKDLARRSGMTLGEWLNQMIMDDGAPDEASPARPAALSSPAAASAYERFEAPEHPGDDVLRASQALDRLSARIEAAEQRATLAISGIDQSVSGVLSRLESTEREQIAVAGPLRGRRRRTGRRARAIDRTFAPHGAGRRRPRLRSKRCAPWKARSPRWPATSTTANPRPRNASPNCAASWTACANGWPSGGAPLEGAVSRTMRSSSASPGGWARPRSAPAPRCAGWNPPSPSWTNAWPAPKPDSTAAAPTLGWSSSPPAFQPGSTPRAPRWRRRSVKPPTAASTAWSGRWRR